MTNTEELPIPFLVPLEYRVNLAPVAATILPGHRLRLDISSSDVASHLTLPYPARNTIFHTANHPSALILTTVNER